MDAPIVSVLLSWHHGEATPSPTDSLTAHGSHRSPFAIEGFTPFIPRTALSRGSSLIHRDPARATARGLGPLLSSLPPKESQNRIDRPLAGHCSRRPPFASRGPHDVRASIRSPLAIRGSRPLASEPRFSWRRTRSPHP